MRVRIAACARQDPRIFALFVRSLARLDLGSLDVSYHFILHNWPEGRRLLADLRTDRQVIVGSHRSPNAYVTSEAGHRWTVPLLSDMAEMKNRILRRALSDRMDAVLFVDTDLLFDPATLQTLIAAQVPIVAEVFWTAWGAGETPMPNAWDFDHYGFLPGNPDRWREPGLYRVGGTGACILIRMDAVRRGVDYRLVPGVSWWGEDRAMQLRAAVAGVRIYLDTHHPAHHLYRPSALDALAAEEEAQALYLGAPDAVRSVLAAS